MDGKNLKRQTLLPGGSRPSKLPKVSVQEDLASIKTVKDRESKRNTIVGRNTLVRFDESTTHQHTTPNSTKELLSKSNFVAGGAEIARIANPWDFYDRAFSLEQSGTVDVGTNRKNKNDCSIFAIKKMDNGSSMDVIRQLILAQCSESPGASTCLAAFYEIFIFESRFYLVEEYLDITLGEVMGCPILFGETEICMVASDVVMAIEFLRTQDLQHGAINKTNIGLTRHGRVRLLSCENCTRLARVENMDFLSLGQTISAMMRRIEELDGGEKCWSSNIINFRNSTTYATVRDVLEPLHPFLQGSKDHMNCLISLVAKATICAKRRWAP